MGDVRWEVLRPIPLLQRRRMRREARAALDEIGIHIPDINAPAGQLSGGQPTAETSVAELTEIVVEEYRRARHLASQGRAPALAG